MIDHDSPATPEYGRPTKRLTRMGRLSRRVVLPLTLVALATALAVTGYSRLSGAPASTVTPFTWDGSTAHVSGGQAAGTYTTCVITPAEGQRRVVEVPGSSGELTLEPWFDGTARITCGQSVMITSGWQSTLYPYLSRQPVLLGLAALAVLAWWFGRVPRRRLPDCELVCGGKVDVTPVM